MGAREVDLYAAMSEANGLIVHRRGRDELLQAVCRFAVEHVRFRFARVSLINFQAGKIESVCAASRDPQDAERFGMLLDPERVERQGLSRTALATGENLVCNDIYAEPRTHAWRDVLVDLGVRSLAVFLLRRQGKAVGTLNLYAGQSGFFDGEMVALLDKLSMNLSYALENFQSEEARQAAVAALRDSETRFRDFAAAAGEFVWESDLEGRLTYLSSRVLSVWGYSDQELIGHTPAEFMPPGEGERVREWIRHNMRGDGSFNDLEHMIIKPIGRTDSGSCRGHRRCPGPDRSRASRCGTGCSDPGCSAPGRSGHGHPGPCCGSRSRSGSARSGPSYSGRGRPNSGFPSRVHSDPSRRDPGCSGRGRADHGRADHGRADRNCSHPGGQERRQSNHD